MQPSSDYSIKINVTKTPQLSESSNSANERFALIGSESSLIQKTEEIVELADAFFPDSPQQTKDLFLKTIEEHSFKELTTENSGSFSQTTISSEVFELNVFSKAKDNKLNIPISIEITQAHHINFRNNLVKNECFLGEIHEDHSDPHTINLKSYHHVDSPRGRELLAQGKGLILDKTLGLVATHADAKNKAINKKIVLHDDLSAHPDLRKLIDSLNEKPITISYFNEEMMQEFHIELINQIMTFQATDSIPHAKTSSEDIQRMNRVPMNHLERERVKERKDSFGKTKELLIQIFLSSYQIKAAKEKERAEKAREEEKENKVDLEKKDKKKDIEKKEHKDAADKVVLANKNESDHAVRNQAAAEIDSKSLSRLKQRSK